MRMKIPMPAATSHRAAQNSSRGQLGATRAAYVISETGLIQVGAGANSPDRHSDSAKCNDLHSKAIDT